MLNDEELKEIFDTLSQVEDVKSMREKITDPAVLVITEQEQRRIEEFLIKYDS